MFFLQRTCYCLMCVFRDSLRSLGWHRSAAPTLIGCWPLSLAWMGSHLGTFHSHRGLSVAAAGEIAFLFPYNGWSELDGARVSLSLSWQWKLIPLPPAPFWNPLQHPLIRGHHETSRKLRYRCVCGKDLHTQYTLTGRYTQTQSGLILCLERQPQAWTNTSAKNVYYTAHLTSWHTVCPDTNLNCCCYFLNMDMIQIWSSGSVKSISVWIK